MRPAMVLLLIASLLSCPLRCAFGSSCADAHPTITASQACCHDCDSSEALAGKIAAEEHSEPACPCADCECLACICNGAMVEGEFSSVELDFEAPEWMAFDSLTPLAASANLCRGVDDRRSAKSPFISGRAARIGLQSLLI